LGARLHNVDYESCTIAGRQWLVTDTETLHQASIQCPQVTLTALNINQFGTFHANIYPSLPDSKNLQPDGSVILSARVKITDPTFGIVLPARYEFNSIKRKNGHFTVKRLQQHDDDER
jgi:hypothetical protein